MLTSHKNVTKLHYMKVSYTHNSEKNISLAFKQATYQLYSLYRTKAVITFSGGTVPKKCNFVQSSQPCTTKTALHWVLNVCKNIICYGVYKLINLHLRYEMVMLWTVMIWYRVIVLFQMSWTADTIATICKILQFMKSKELANIYIKTAYSENVCGSVKHIILLSN
jgi:hypothetical protein